MDKENNVRGISRKAKAAPDFSKLHRQWNAKLQKGKAVTKKPLTEVHPFQLSQKLPVSKSSSSVSDDEFVVDAAAKENILFVTGFHEIETTKPHRATICALPSGNQTKSSIPRPSFISSKRNSLYVKSNNSVNTSTIKINTTPSTIKKQQQSCNVVTATNCNETLATFGNFTNYANKSYLKNNPQGFEVDFEPDADALNSILNGKGIERLPRSPPPQNNNNNSTLGPVKNQRTKGRVVPFSRPSAAARLNGNGRKIQADNSTANINTAKQRWSIHSRDSYSSKPDLMDWLQKMIDDSKAKRATAKLENPTSTNSSKETTSVAVGELAATTMTTAATTTANSTSNQSNSLLFKKTLIGYQGDEKPESPVTDFNRKITKMSDDKSMAKTILTDNTTTTTVVSEAATYTTPAKRKGPLSTYTNGSIVKSILKTKPIISTVKKQQTPNTHGDRNIKKLFVAQHQKSPATPARKTMFAATPVRLSAYARQQRKMGLPLPKENRYETFGEKVTGPSCKGSVIKSPNLSTSSNKINSEMITSMTFEATSRKSVRWADNLESSSAPKEDLKEICDNEGEHFQSPAAKSLYRRNATEESKAKEERFISVNNHQQTPYAVKKPTSPPPSFQSFLNNNKISLNNSNNSKLSSSSHLHKIKYVMPAEQPLEKMEKKQGRTHQVHKSLFQQKTIEKVDLQKMNIGQQELATPLVSAKTTFAVRNNSPLQVKTTQKSWAQVLGEELDVSAGNIFNTDNGHELPDQSGQFNKSTVQAVSSEGKSVKKDPVFVALSTKKTKKRSNKRISILEKIYGNAIKFRDASPDPASTTAPTVASLTSNSRSCSSFGAPAANTSLGLGFRPVPSIDDKLMGDLMSFHESDSEEDDAVLKEYSYFEKVDEDVNESRTSEEQPFQSTMLATPSNNNAAPPIEDVVLMEFTPVLDEHSVSDNSLSTSTKLPEAPCKRLTKARTPYKQEMLDILERTLAAAREKKINEYTLDCTINNRVNNLSIVIADHPAKSCENTLIEVDASSGGPSQNFDLENLQNVKSTTEDSPVAKINYAGTNSDSEKSSLFQSSQSVGGVCLPEIIGYTSQNIRTTEAPSLPYSSEPAKHSTRGFQTTNSIFSLGTQQNVCWIEQRSSTTAETDKQQIVKNPWFVPVAKSNHQFQKEEQMTSNMNSTKALPNIRSPSMRLFSSSSDVISKLHEHSATGLFSGKPRLSGICAAQATSMFNITATTTTTKETTSQSVPFFNTQPETTPLFNTTTIHTVTPYSKALTTDATSNNTTTMFRNPLSQTHASVFSASNSLRSQPQVTASLFPAPPLFSSLSRDMKFSTSSDKNVTVLIDKPDKDTTSTLLKPSKLSNENNHASVPDDKYENHSQFESTWLNDSSTLNESDICMVFKKHQPTEAFKKEKKENVPPATKQTATTMLPQKQDSPKIKGSAFRCVLPSYEEQFKQSSHKSIEDIKNSYNKLLINDLYTESATMCVDTEVAMYTKIREMKKDRGDWLDEGTLLRDGALNVVAVLLTYGDSRHFVPINEME